MQYEKPSFYCSKCGLKAIPNWFVKVDRNLSIQMLEAGNKKDEKEKNQKEWRVKKDYRLEEKETGVENVELGKESIMEEHEKILESQGHVEVVEPIENKGGTVEAKGSVGEDNDKVSSGVEETRGGE